MTGTLADRSGWLAAYGLVAALLAVPVGLLAVNRAFGIDACTTAPGVLRPSDAKLTHAACRDGFRGKV
ncbi:MAG: hypothetical protein ABEJ73_00580 [Haloplanus sp.]